VYKNKTTAGVTVSAVDPVEMLKITGREDLNAFALEVKDRLNSAIGKL